MSAPSGPAASSRRPTLVLIPLVAVLVAIVGALVLLDGRPEEPAPRSGPAAFGPPSAPLVVEISRATRGPAHLGYPERVTISALGLAGVAAVELWVGSERVQQSATTDTMRPAVQARWEWTPDEPGDAVLVARAYDPAGRAAQSSALRVRVVAEPLELVRLTEEGSLEGETLDDVAARLGLSAEDLRDDNPELAAGPLAAGTVVVVRRPVTVPPPEPASAADRPPTAVAPGGLHDLADARPVADVQVVPDGLAIPGLVATVDDCTVEATASGGGEASAGFSFTVLPPVGDTFIAMPPLAPSGDGSATASFAALAGLNLLTVSSYDAGATAPSAIVPVVVPDECNGGWSGDAILSGGHLTVPGAPDEAYLYLRLGEGSWQRVPAAEGSFVKPIGGTLDFSPYLPPIVGKDLRLEAWGWTGGGLAKLGAGEYNAPAEVFYSGGLDVVADPIIGFGTNLDIVTLPGYDPLVQDGPSKENELPEHLEKHSTIDRPGPASTSAKRMFKWSTTVPGVTHLVWQVLPYPLGTTSTTLTPPFLIDSDSIEVKGATGGYFTIDFKPYLLGALEASWTDQLLAEQVVDQLAAQNLVLPGSTPAPGGGGINTLVDPGWIYLPGSSPPPSGGSGSLGSPELTQSVIGNLATISQLALSSIYVRIIPFIGATPLPNASNSVGFDIVEPADPIYIDTSPPPPPPTYPDAHTLQAQFFAPTGSSKAYYQCAIIVENNLANTNPNKIFYPVGQKLCPKEEDDGWSIGDAFDAFVGWVGDVWDFAVGAYEWVKEQVVAAMLFVVPCETIAKTAANADDADAKAACKVIAKTALDAALATFGIPPEIPDWKAVLTAAKGDLKTFILDQAQLIPGVSEACLATDVANQVADFTTCEQLIDKAIDEAVKQIAKQRSDAAAAPLGYSIPSGVLIEPHPKSMPQPPHFTITLTRTNAPLPSDVECHVSASMTSTYGDGVVTWTWNEYEWDGGNPTVVNKGPAVVTGHPFVSGKQKLAALNPGQSMTIELWLSKPNVWFEPDGWNDWYAEQYAKWNGSYNHAWVLLLGGATVTGKVSSNCSNAFESTQVLTGSAYS